MQPRGAAGGSRALADATEPCSSSIAMRYTSIMIILALACLTSTTRMDYEPKSSIVPFCATI